MLRALLANVTWKVLLVAALVLCTALAWGLFEFARMHRLDAVFATWLRAARVTIQVLFRVDPVMMLVVFPLGVLIVLILVGLLIWLQRTR